MKPQTVDKIVTGVIIVIAVICFGCAIQYHRAVKKLTDKICENPTPEVPAVIHYDNAADYYLDWFFKMEKRFKETGLGTIVGKDNLDTYTVGADSTVQRKLDELLWKYCLQTSDLFGTVCGYMNEKRDYSDKMFDVLATIVNSQETYVQKYGSDLLKEDAKQNTFKYEEERLTEVVNQTLYKESRLLDYLKSKTK